jgi:hypothetical protein
MTPLTAPQLIDREPGQPDAEAAPDPRVYPALMAGWQQLDLDVAPQLKALSTQLLVQLSASQRQLLLQSLDQTFIQLASLAQAARKPPLVKFLQEARAQAKTLIRSTTK